MSVLVNKEEIKDSEIKEEFNRLLPYYNQHVRENNPDANDKQLYEWAKENLIEKVLMKQEAMKDLEKVQQPEIKKVYKDIKDNYDKVSLEELIPDIESQIKYERLIKRLQSKVELPTEEELKEYYEKDRDQYIIPEQVHAAHIVKHINQEVNKKTAKKEIGKIQEELKQGAVFEELASKHSDCPDSGGDLGFFPRGQMVQEFEDVVFLMKPDEVSDIFLSSFGYHIAKVYEKEPSRHIPFDKVKDRISEELLKEKQTKAVEDFVDKLKEKAVIEEIKAKTEK